MNRGTIRSTVLSRRSWHADVDAAFVEEVNTVCIDGALKRLASEVPEAFIPDRETVYLLADQDQDTLSRTVAATTDPYVLSFGLAGVAMAVNGTADGLFHIEVVTSDGRVLSRQCREFWLETTGPYANHYLVSIDHPWEDSTSTGMDFRLFQPYFYLRDNVTELVDGRIFDNARQLLTTLPAGFVRKTSQEDFRGTYRGRPEAFSRWEMFQLAAPNRTPTVALVPGAVPDPPWVGPEPVGAFSYRYTYVWGKKNFEVVAPGGGYDPTWESAPSPESASITVANLAAAVVVSTLTNIDFQLGFGTTGTVRKGHSGLRKRIYRARSAVTAGGGLETNLEYPNIYFFLAEVDGETTSYTDDGSVIPDYHRRLPESRGYYAWAPVPHQDATYRVDLRVYRRPLSLLVDSDAPPIHPDFDDLFENLVLARLCEMDKSPEAALVYENAYKERLLAYRAKEANPAALVPPEPWHPDRAFADSSRYTPYRSS
jgi:hypothetical protein